MPLLSKQPNTTVWISSSYCVVFDLLLSLVVYLLVSHMREIILYLSLLFMTDDEYFLICLLAIICLPWKTEIRLLILTSYYSLVLPKTLWPGSCFSWKKIELLPLLCRVFSIQKQPRFSQDSNYFSIFQTLVFSGS